MSKLFRNGLLVGITLFAITACSEDEMTERENIFSKEYQLEEIVWETMAGDETISRTFEESHETSSQKISEKLYSATVNTVQDVKQSSIFFSNDPELFIHLIGTTPFSIPVPSKDLNTATSSSNITSGIRVPFSLEKYIFPTLDNSSQTVTIEVPFKVKSIWTIEESQVSATYRARFKDVKGGHEVEITGKWKGLFYNIKHQTFTTLDK